MLSWPAFGYLNGRILRGRNGGIWLIFFLYVSLVFVFGYVYQAIYQKDHNSFIFASDVIRAQRDRFVDHSRNALSLLSSKKQVLSGVLLLLKDEKAPKMRTCGRDSVCVSYVVGGSQLRFVSYWGGPSDWAPEDVGGLPNAVGSRPVFNLAGYKPFYRQAISPPPMRVWRLECMDGKILRWSIRLGLARASDIPPTSQVLRAMVEPLLTRIIAQINLLNSQLSHADSVEIWSYWDFVYFSGITLTTVGYGDILPNTTEVRIVVLAQVLVGIFLTVFFLSRILSP